MKIAIEITPELIANLMTSAIESGDPVTTASRGGWCAGVYLRGQWEKRIAELDQFWYNDPKLYASDAFTLEILEVIDESKPLTKKNLKQHMVMRADFVRGFEVMAKVFPHQFADLMNDNADAPCADVFLQAMLFGEEKYA